MALGLPGHVCPEPQTPVPGPWGACATSSAYRHLALGVIRVRDGQIVHYDDYMDPIAVTRRFGRTSELAAALGST